jgi:hypothetical protein
LLWLQTEPTEREFILFACRRLLLLLLLQISTKLAGGTSKGELSKLGQLQVG